MKESDIRQSFFFKKIVNLTLAYSLLQVRREVSIVNNMASLHKEEIGPLASTDAVLLAPEELHKPMVGVIKADEEKTKTDRLRARRKKKVGLSCGAEADS